MERVVYDYDALAKRIEKKYSTRAEFCKVSGMKPSLLSQKLSGDIGMTQKDIEMFICLLGIGKKRLWEYFFTKKVYVA